MNEVSAIDNLSAANLKRYYPSGVPNGSRFVSEINPEWKGLYFSPSAGIIELLTTSVSQYFNDHHTQFTSEQELSFPAFTAKPISIEIDDNGKKDWLVEVEFIEYQFITWLPLTTNSNGTYTLIPNDLPLRFTVDSNTTINFDANHDLTGDGRNDVVIAYTSYFAGGIRGNLSIYSWEKQGIYLLDTGDLRGVSPRFGETHESQYDIADHNGDGYDEIQVTWPRFRPFGCSWQTQYTDRWAGQTRIETVTNLDIPDQPDCYIAKALESENLVEQTQWFEAALTVAESKNSSQDLIAWIRLHLAVAYSSQGRDEDATQVMHSLINAGNQGHFLRAIQDTYRQTDSSPVSICKTLYANADAMGESNSTFESDIDNDLSFDYAYPISYTPIPELVCP